MTRSKLSTSDKEELIRLFKETTETITNLANRFQVSVSTARRVLKTELTDEAYELIVASRMEGRQKKSAPVPIKKSFSLDLSPDDGDDEMEDEVSPKRISSAAKPSRRRSRRRTSAEDSVSLVSEEPSNNFSSESDGLSPEASVGVEDNPLLEVLPIDTATLPNQCYLVVDHAAELITPPLKEFSELGAIPAAEELAKTLPIFPNHKIASRFSRRSQRIIKVPNSAILKKTYPMLTAKGVERILFDGQVFSLVNETEKSG